MTTITLAQAIQAAQGSANAALTAIGAEKSVTGFVVDSRSVRPGVLFVAIAGENVDGHDFAQDAVN
ncbi:MAG: UDP-N-acetylmuramoyl-tripeptide--D-alanyl-D-alanine ligase, partial [Actinobacteria bacterium]|nr:UDP-N-acetylmuramoyl-tripeptide--D-alanyl-D-alanine ligase [Actinomycetota bacterium]